MLSMKFYLDFISCICYEHLNAYITFFSVVIDSRTD